jgi:hypothetical protein
MTTPATFNVAIDLPADPYLLADTLRELAVALTFGGIEAGAGQVCDPTGELMGRWWTEAPQGGGRPSRPLTLAEVRQGTGWPRGVRFRVVAPGPDIEDHHRLYEEVSAAQWADLLGRLPVLTEGVHSTLRVEHGGTGGRALRIWLSRDRQQIRVDELDDSDWWPVGVIAGNVTRSEVGGGLMARARDLTEALVRGSATDARQIGRDSTG